MVVLHNKTGKKLETKGSFQTGTCKEVPGTHRDMNISTGYYYDSMSGLLQNNNRDARTSSAGSEATRRGGKLPLNN